MPLQADLEAKIKTIYATYSASSIAIPSNKGNVYELYVFLLTFDTISNLNPTTAIQSPGASFSFRCSPGKIDNSRFSYVTFTKNGTDYELRNGIEVIGHNMYHEIDVSIFIGTQTDQKRPNQSALKLSVECKNHAKLGPLKGESRKYLGCITDLCNALHHATAGCITCGIPFDAGFATPVSAPSSHKYYRYLNSYSLNPMFDLRPYTSTATDFINYITQIYNSL
jgi:hypothetical protein